MLDDLISRARRRFLLNEALGQLAFAAAIAIGGLAFILLVGTRWLEWWTLSVFAGIGIAVGGWKVWRSSPDHYVTAVRLDANAGLHDSLSTALHFAGHENSNILKLQREQADAAAATVDLKTAVPFTLPHALYVLGGVVALASVLLLVRFNTGRGLDLQAPLTEVLFEDQAARQQAKQKKSYSDPERQKSMEAAESLLAKLGIPLNPDEKQTEAALTKAIDEALDGAGAAADKGKKGPGAGKSDDGKAGNGLEQTPDGDSMDGKTGDGKDAAGAESKTPGGDKGQKGQQADKGAQKNGQGGDSSSLLSKLKDAVSNMMSKSNQDSGKDGKDKAGQKGAQQPGQQAKSDKASGDKSSGKGQEQQGPQQGDAQAGDPNGDPQEGQQAEGKAGSKSAQSSAQAGSGVGSQDGAKDIHAAEQLKAMGKISEIIGKRAASVTGETTIEVQSGNQQLRTAYTTKSATHGQADSDVSRDQIPVGLQNYVQQYFEQVRKSPSATAKPGGK